MELNWNFQRGGEVSGKIPSVGEVWIFLLTTHYDLNIIVKSYLDCSATVLQHVPI